MDHCAEVAEEVIRKRSLGKNQEYRLCSMEMTTIRYFHFPQHNNQLECAYLAVTEKSEGHHEVLRRVQCL